MLIDRRNDDLLPLPVGHVPGLDEDVVPIHPVVEDLRLAPLHVEGAVAGTGEVGYEGPGEREGQSLGLKSYNSISFRQLE